MKLFEVIRPSDKAEERAKIAAKEDAMRARVVKAYVRGMTAPQYKPHIKDVEYWLFGKGSADSEAIEELKSWAGAICSLVKVTINDPRDAADHEGFRIFSHHIDVPLEMVDFVCGGGVLPEVKK